MKVFLDANILVSVLNKEYPVFSYSSRILSLSDTRYFILYTTPLCLAIAFYFAEKKSGHALAKKKIDTLVQHISVIDMNETGVIDTLNNKSIHDFEDGLEYYAARDAKCVCIITQDRKDFYFSEIEVLDAEDFLKKHVQ
jgi:predicted nucleic acid-binding protein